MALSITSHKGVKGKNGKSQFGNDFIPVQFEESNPGSPDLSEASKDRRRIQELEFELFVETGFRKTSCTCRHNAEGRQCNVCDNFAGYRLMQCVRMKEDKGMNATGTVPSKGSLVERVSR